MAEDRVARKLAAILYADVAGYSRLTGADEEGTHRTVADYLDAITGMVADHGGRVVHYAGDAILAEFASVVVAVICAVELQRNLADRNRDLPEDRKVQFRIGVNLGDVIVDRGELFGDGVNVAARLQARAEPGGICLSRTVYNHIKGKVDLGFEDLGEQKFKNISEPVRVFRVLLDSENDAEPIGPAPNSQPSTRPTIAVLPFDNMSGDPDQEYFADGISEDIITELSRLRGFFVIARNSSFAFKGQSVAVDDVARELGVRYVLEGSVRRAGNRVRVTAQLIEGETGAHIWAERYDRLLEDIFEIQDEITRQIVGALEPSLLDAEAKRSNRQLPENLDAWAYVARAMPLIWTWSKDGYEAGAVLLRKAIELDPNYSRAHSILAVGLVSNAWFGRSGSGAALTQKAFEEANLAVELDVNDPWSHLALGFAYGYRRDSNNAFAEMEQSLKLNPNFALARALYGLTLGWAGASEKALEQIDLAERLSPHDVINIHLPAIRGVA